jgi:hypothetical protein
MGKSSRPKGAYHAGKCVKCHGRTKRLCSNGECDLCNPNKFQSEFKCVK